MSRRGAVSRAMRASIDGWGSGWDSRPRKRRSPLKPCRSANATWACCSREPLSRFTKISPWNRPRRHTEPAHGIEGRVEQPVIRRVHSQGPEEAEHARREGSEEELRAATARYTQANWRAAAAREYFGKATTARQMQAIRIGDIALLSVEGEPFAEIGLRIAEASPFPHTLFSGYSNGGFGYIPTREAIQEGGYEAIQGSPYSGGAADVVVDQGLKLLGELKEEAE